MQRLTKTLLDWLKRLILGWLGISLVVILLLRLIDPPFWAWKLHRELNPPVGYPQRTQHQWLDLEQIPPAMQLAVVAAEDQRFPLHHGIDFQAISDSIGELKRRKPLRGASTLTQQTVKNLFLWEGRDWSRKLLEACLALLVELLWDKQRILEVYLNIVEFGPGIYGVGAASEYWYHHPAKQLTPDEAARLAAILPNPWAYRAKPPSPYVVQRAKWIEQQMEQLGYAWLRPVTGR